MMFLFKLAFWLGLVLVLLPTGSKRHTTDTQQIEVAEAATAATAAVSDLSRFCTRQPDSCAVGSQVAGVLARRAKDGAVMVYELITERDETTSERTRVPPARRTVIAHDGHGPDRGTTGSVGAAPAAMLPRPRPTRSQDTLTAADRTPVWRPGLRREAQVRTPRQ